MQIQYAQASASSNLRYTPVDVDNDGKPDKMNLMVTMPLSDTPVADVQKVTLHSVFSLGLKDKVHLNPYAIKSRKT